MDWGFTNGKDGYLEVVSGCMFSGKTEELIRQMRRCDYAKQSYIVFKPKVDNRYSSTEVTSHNQDGIPSIVIEDPKDIFLHIRKETQVIGIDEAQFFPDALLMVVKKLIHHGRRVVVAGLDTDWRGEPFGPMPQLLAMAQIVRKQYAICMLCGASATRTQRLVPNREEILVGSQNLYEARCHVCHDPHLRNLEVGDRRPAARTGPSKEKMIQPSTP